MNYCDVDLVPRCRNGLVKVSKVTLMAFEGEQ